MYVFYSFAFHLFWSLSPDEILIAYKNERKTVDEIRLTEIDGKDALAVFPMANFLFTLASCSGGNIEAWCRCFGSSRETEVTISVFLCWQGVGHATTVKGGAMDKPKVDIPNFRTGQVSLRWGTLCMLVLHIVYDCVSTFIIEGWNHINSVISTSSLTRD